MRGIYIILSFGFVFFQSTLNAKAAPTYPAEVNSGNAYSGEGGVTKGGDVVAPKHHDLIDDLKIHILSNNAGNGGDSSSGDATGILSNALGGHGHGEYDNGNAYTGEGGQAPGGTVDVQPGLLNLLSNNAGSGGHAKSGSIGERPAHSVEIYPEHSKEYRDHPEADC